MLIAAKFDSYCPCCGRPIFTGDLMEYLGYKNVRCIVCYSNIKPYDECPHWSVESYSKQYTGSRKYPHGYGISTNAEFKCLTCKKTLDKYPENNKFIFWKSVTYHQHGGAWGGHGVTGGIEKGNSSAIGDNDPDSKSLYILRNILDKNCLEASVAQIALNHIRRILNN